VDAAFPPRCAQRFRARTLLGEGGFGRVWLAEQAGLGRPVALKILGQRALTDPTEIERFRAEARMTARLAHPSIVVVLDHDVEDGVPWIAYELLEGESLRARLARGPLPGDEVIAIARQLAGALDVVHRAGILHRDLKPDNVLAAGEGRWKLTDFGIAKWTLSGVQTATGVILGTPAYLAPELVGGAEASPASDLYALGVLLHELLRGQPPFDGDSPMLVLQSHVQRTPPPLPASTPPALARLVERLLAKDPAERPESALAVMRALDPAPASANVRTVRASRPGVHTAKPRPSSRLPLVLTALAAVAAAWSFRPRAEPLPLTSPPSATPSVAASPSPSMRAADALRLIATFTERAQNATAERPEGDRADPKRDELKTARARAAASRVYDLLADMVTHARKLPIETPSSGWPEFAIVQQHVLDHRALRRAPDEVLRQWQDGWVRARPECFLGPLVLAELEAHGEREVALRTEALRLYERAFVARAESTQDFMLLKCWTEQMYWLANAHSPEEDHPQPIVALWRHYHEELAKMKAPLPAQIETLRVRLRSKLAKAGGVRDADKLPMKTYDNNRINGLELARDELAMALKTTEAVIESWIYGVCAVEWMRRRACTPGARALVAPPPIVQAARAWLEAELRETALPQDGAQHAVRHLRAMDLFDQLAPAVMETALPPEFRTTVAAGMYDVIHRGGGLALVGADHAAMMLKRWRDRHGESWVLSHLASALARRRGDAALASREARMAVDLFARSERPGSPALDRMSAILRAR
jgi:serine/threonine protein kinase